MRTTVRYKKATPRLLAALALGTALLASACSTSSSATSSSATAGSPNSKNFTFDNVVKLSGSTWFERMAVGVQAFSKATGIPTNQQGPAQPTAEQQVSMITSLIPQHPTVIGVDPDDVAASEGVLAQAQKAGVIVVSQEGATLQNTDFDLEAFSNAT